MKNQNRKNYFKPPILTSPQGRHYTLIGRMTTQTGYVDRIKFKDDNSYLHIFYDRNGNYLSKQIEIPKEFRNE